MTKRRPGPNLNDLALEVGFVRRCLPPARKKVLRSALIGSQEVVEEPSAEGFFHAIVDGLDDLLEFALPNIEFDPKIRSLASRDDPWGLIGALNQVLWDALDARANGDLDVLLAQSTAVSLTMVALRHQLVVREGTNIRRGRKVGAGASVGGHARAAMLKPEHLLWLQVARDIETDRSAAGRPPHSARALAQHTAKRVGANEHTVRTALRKLLDR